MRWGRKQSVDSQGLPGCYPQHSLKASRQFSTRLCTACVRAHSQAAAWSSAMMGRCRRQCAYLAPRLRLIETAEISLPGDWIEIDCWLLRVLTASMAEKTGLLARRLI